MAIKKTLKHITIGNEFRYLTIILLGLLFAYMKLTGTSIDNTLWAEDGSIFINQAREYGVASLWMTYNGYFHLYPRLIAWFSSFIDISLTPLIFFAAWVLTYITLIFIVTKRARLFCSSFLEIGLLIFLMLAQPHRTNEVFFNLTNAQWFIGAALAIYLLVPIKDTSTIWEKIILLIAFMTGPFTLVLTPILLIQLLIFKDWHDRKHVYMLAEFSALIQIAAIILSNRLTDTPFDKNPMHWVTAFLNFFTFGNFNVLVILSYLIFWSVSIYALLLNWKLNIGRHYNSTGTISLSLVVGTALLFTSGLLAHKGYPDILNTWEHGARYFYIPYLLFLFAAWLALLGQPKLKLLVFVSWLTLCGLSFSIIERSDLQFQAYAEFAKKKNNVLIPIHPQIENNNHWHIRLHDVGPPDADKSKIHPITLNLADAKMENIIKTQDLFQTPTYSALNEDPQISFDISGICPHSNHIGFEAQLVRDRGGWIQFFWRENDEYSGNQLLQRHYPANHILVQFAIPAHNIKYIRLDPLDQKGRFQVPSISLYCL